eukprot:TRINITY_DN17657_c0_g1_i1.p1 TRINITY_DN17657_c0_g1~~TRINITY_DN17657_c0_g1_i1.p1  ORF type:complete len:247 (+),score=39.57 TRINITY_DN17657_c0_g1_i1:82-822(+)
MLAMTDECGFGMAGFSTFNFSPLVSDCSSAGISQRTSIALIRASISNSREYKRKASSVYLSSNPRDVDIKKLRVLLKATNQNCCLFPEILEDGRSKTVDTSKLQIALMNSTVVVSAYTLPEASVWLNRLVTGKKVEKQLVGFGRAISDGSFTASVHDLAVEPSLQRLGIGKRILKRIVRILTSQGINDISVLCFSKQRPFFQACGFAEDILNSTTMIYSGRHLSFSRNVATERISKLAKCSYKKNF